MEVVSHNFALAFLLSTKVSQRNEVDVGLKVTTGQWSLTIVTEILTAKKFS